MRRMTALVTGASRGIGRAIARQLSEDGFRIALHFNTNESAVETSLASLHGKDHLIMAADLSNPDGSSALAAGVLDEFDGRVDILVHNAGIYRRTPILGTASLAEWQESLRRQMQLNFFAGADLSYLLAESMAENKWGRIIHIASRSGLQGEPEFSAYGASKAAQINLMKSLAVELAPSGIGCFAIAPGWVETEMSADTLASKGAAIRKSIPVGRVASPDDVAAIVRYLVTPAADYLTGNTIDVNGASYLR